MVNFNKIAKEWAEQYHYELDRSHFQKVAKSIQKETLKQVEDWYRSQYSEKCKTYHPDCLNCKFWKSWEKFKNEK